jgi:hypothetical protein
MISMGAMLQRIHGLLETGDLNTWETGFVESVWEKSAGGTRTSALTSVQAEKVEQIFSKHFAG